MLIGRRRRGRRQRGRGIRVMREETEQVWKGEFVSFVVLLILFAPAWMGASVLCSIGRSRVEGLRLQWSQRPQVRLGESEDTAREDKKKRTW